MDVVNVGGEIIVETGGIVTYIPSCQKKTPEKVSSRDCKQYTNIHFPLRLITGGEEALFDLYSCFFVTLLRFFRRISSGS